MKVYIKSWKGVALWSWDVPKEEVCGICRVSFDGTCPTCKYPGDECPLIIGKCTHRFHTHCIIKWLETEASKSLCPMCRQPFETEGSCEGDSQQENDANLGSTGSAQVRSNHVSGLSEAMS